VTIPLADDVVVHRVGGASVLMLRLSAADLTAVPPGLSVLLGGTPQEAADTMRIAINTRKWQRLASQVGTATVASVRAAGFDVIFAPTGKLPTHGRIVHVNGPAGFTDANLAVLAGVFSLTTGC
jgi:hypothetical protein